MIETNQAYCQDTDELEHQIDQENLISGRLGFYYCKQADADDHVDDRPARYGISRLGLAVEEPPCEVSIDTDESAAQEAPAEPVEAIQLVSQAEQFGGPCKRGSYKLPAKLIGWLRALAKTTEKYQYSIVSEALSKHLAELTAGLDADKTAEVARLRKEFEESLAEIVGEQAAAQPEQSSTNQLGCNGDQDQPS